MTLTLLAVFALAMAAIPCRWVFRNRTDYRPAPSRPAGSTTEQLGRISVLVPARNEEHNIRATVQSILASRGVEFEVILLDDQSTDRTAEIAPSWPARIHACVWNRRRRCQRAGAASNTLATCSRHCRDTRSWSFWTPTCD